MKILVCVWMNVRKNLCLQWWFFTIRYFLNNFDVLHINFKKCIIQIFKCIFLRDHAVDVCANLYWANSFEGGSTYLIIVLQYRKQWMINIVDILLLFGWEEYHIFFFTLRLKKSRHSFGVSQYPELTSCRRIYTGHWMYVWKN